MVSAFESVFDKGFDPRVGGDMVAWLDFLVDLRRKGRLREDLAHQPDTGAHVLPVIRVAHPIEPDARLLPWGRARRAAPTPALRAHWPDMHLEGVAPHDRSPIIADGERQEVVLEVWPRRGH